MNYKEINDKLKQLKNEEIIWIIYIGIIALSFYANSLEKQYFVNNNQKSKEQYRHTMILIFSILIVVYLYFLKDAYEDIKNLNPCDSEEKRKLLTLSFIGSLLIAISGFIFLYISIKDEKIDVELAFN